MGIRKKKQWDSGNKMSRPFIRGYAKYGVFFKHHKIQETQWCMFIDTFSIIPRDLADTDRWFESTGEWKDKLNFVETRKNRIHRW